MKDTFSLRTVRKKILMLSKLAGLALIFSYILSTRLPVNEDTNFILQYELPEQKFFVQTDHRRMEQVLDNLIVNAKKNVHPGGILRLELALKGGALHFSIFNQGRPIPESELPKIWTKFYRDSDAEYSGSGLGLSIVAQILSMQKLSYGAENQADGVRFYFSIPVIE